jgi:hypothetical protein
MTKKEIEDKCVIRSIEMFKYIKKHKINYNIFTLMIIIPFKAKIKHIQEELKYKLSGLFSKSKTL